ncbi:hypothetical protein BLOT_011903 [Blomia tropicalis]|nr:hypothetical protein BLOT_011903 [Blomia tropicalis]
MSDSKNRDLQLFDVGSNDIGLKVSKSSISHGGTSVQSLRSNPSSISAMITTGSSNNVQYPFGESKYDCIAFVIHCTKHSKVAVFSTPRKEQWLPFTPLPPNKTWNECAAIGTIIILSGGEKDKFLSLKSHPPFSRVELMNVFRLQLPHTQRFLTRLIYYIPLNQTAVSEKSFKCCQSTKSTEWESIESVARGEMKHPLGPELAKFSKLALKQFSQHFSEYRLSQAFKFVPRDPPQNSEETILKSVGITVTDVERLYVDYLNHCFPSSYCSFDSFQHYMEKYGFETDRTRMAGLFRSFQRQNHSFLTYHEFLIGLALMEPSIKHIDLRTRFIFRYYDENGDGTLNKEELSNMIRDMYPKETKSGLELKEQEAQRILRGSGTSKEFSVNFERFQTMVNEKKFRGTGTLCRSSKPIFSQILYQIASRTLDESNTTSFDNVMINRMYNNTCASCSNIKYELAIHKVRCNEAGNVVNCNKLFDQNDNSSKKSTSTNGSTIAMNHSIECTFNSGHIANKIIEKIRKFNKHKGTNINPKGLMSSEPELFCTMVKTLCDLMVQRLKKESRCYRLRAPCFVMGDIHGNLEDLLSLERAIWRRIPCIASNYLFLGDYVDRGRWGLECSLYLMAFKILCPDNVIMLRGNHEVRDLQIRYSYLDECLQKYGKDYGQKIWEMTNSVFDRLPVCAIVNGSIYGAHGGIPKCITNLNHMEEKVLPELSDPQVQSNVAWEILWSDPCHLSQFNDLADITPNSLEEIDLGYIDNVKRGTAHLFNEFAATTFLQTNGLSHIMRGHEVPPLGYTFHFGTKCVTIFSCSHYCGNNNQCATILIDGQVLRIANLDTVNNAPATD